MSEKLVMKFVLAEVREKKKISQMELAIKCGLSLSAIQKYEYGKKQYSHDILEKFCEVLECEPGDLFKLESIPA